MVVGGLSVVRSHTARPLSFFTKCTICTVEQWFQKSNAELGVDPCVKVVTKLWNHGSGLGESVRNNEFQFVVLSHCFSREKIKASPIINSIRIDIGTTTSRSNILGRILSIGRRLYFHGSRFIGIAIFLNGAINATVFLCFFNNVIQAHGKVRSTFLLHF